ncbi:MAG: aminodeoxychorismate/anthranilate synthase component II [Acidobacteria bacterium]|nr:aminodeoxychorismate/anthranilate synthase component II [Acidobacteriota bacterium]
MILIIDNYDSFTYNLAHAFGELGADVVVRRNDAIDGDGIAALAPSKIVISPGPGRPENSGVSLEVIRRFGPTRPVLGVCLGHQAIGQVFGGRVVRAPAPVHGKTSIVEHDGKGVFAGLDGPFDAGRYHSLIVEAEPWPDALEVSATIAGDGTVMGLRHRAYPVHGVQFHPESVLTPSGRAMLKTFLEM